jgi:hypothetical protein
MAFDSTGPHLGLSVAIFILPVLWLLPAAGLLALVRYETRRGGPWLWVHAPLNAAFIGWCVYAVEVLREGIHSPNSPLITIPRLLFVALFYVLVFPAAVDEMSQRMRVFRRSAIACNLLAFVALMAAWLRM